MVSESQADSLILNRNLNTSIPSPDPTSNSGGTFAFEGGDKESGTKEMTEASLGGGGGLVDLENLKASTIG